jgi:hypothetical protein
MESPSHCPECSAIAEELWSAFADLSAAVPSEDELRAAYGLSQMVRGTAESPEWAEELLAEFPFRPRRSGLPGTYHSNCRHPRVRDAILKMARHQIRTGHTVLFRR